MTEQSIAKAQARSDKARAQLSETLSALRDRLLPRTIARNVAKATKEKASDAVQAGTDAVKARPGLAIGAATLAALFFARKPIARAISHDEDETTADPARSPSIPRKGKS